MEKIRIKLNGKEYKLTPVNNNEQEDAQSDIPTLSAFAEQLIRELKHQHRYRTAETYRCALNSFLRFLPEDDIVLSKINRLLISDYEHFMKNKGIVRNSTSFYMRVLRTIYNKAVAYNYVADQKPFDKVYTGIGKTAKRAISIEEIIRIHQLTGLTHYEALARDLFLFSFYTRGMAFIDMAYLTPQNIQNGVLTYRRHKTGEKLSMRWESKMQEIINQNPSPNNHYLLPIIKHNNGHERSQYRDIQRIINSTLKTIGEKAGIEIPLTMYVARHSWASIAHSMNVPINVISDGLGHHSEHTTQIYLKTLNTKALNTVSTNIINAINNLSYEK